MELQQWQKPCLQKRDSEQSGRIALLFTENQISSADHIFHGKAKGIEERDLLVGLSSWNFSKQKPAEAAADMIFPNQAF